MDVNKQPKLVFHGVDILKVGFDASSPRTKDVEILIDCDPKVYYPKDNARFFHIIMDVKLKAQGCFEMNVLGVGDFEVDAEITPEIRKQFVNANAAAIMFPYIRSFITTFSANLGKVTGALVIPPQFFKGELEEVPYL